MTRTFQELVEKLKEIFQLDKPELDFGVYRIMHTRAKEINEFLEKRLALKVKEALAGNAAAEKAALENELAEAIRNAQALGADPEVLPKVRELREKIATLGGNDDAEAAVYSHLLAFFSRYYDDGDFISKRRYKDGIYAIPYSGEEVKLHWANADQYYIKSGENFQNYDFKLDNGAKVHFKLVTAETAKDNIKDNEAVRCFVLWDPANKENVEDEELSASLPDRILEEQDGELYIYFQYLKFKKGTKQADFTKKAVEKIAQELGGELLTKYPIFAKAPTEKDRNRTVLEKHFTNYTGKNTSDYFIHKDLGGFLRRELDFYIKNEMMHLDDIQNIGAFKEIEQNLRRIQAVRTIAGELITFMAQLEDFQKKLWLKKKFVTQCDYCMTMDMVPEKLRDEVLKNEKQLAEWKQLGFPDSVGADLRAARKQDDLFGHDAAPAVDARMVDTKFFDETFKSKLLASIPDIDEKCGGLLIHSENFQALKFLQDKFNQAIQTIFIDPPYNTEDNEGENEFSYKDCYQHSSWMSMMLPRCELSYQILSPNGIASYTISDEELRNSLSIFDQLFNAKNRIGIIEWNSTKSVTNKALISVGHTHIPIYAKAKSYYVTNRTEFRLADTEEGFSNPDNDPRGKWKADPFQVGGVRPNQLYGITNPKTGKTYYPNPGNSWKNEYQTFLKLKEDGRIVFGVSGEAGPQRKRYWFEAKERGKVPKTWWDEEETTTNGTALLKNLFGICPFKNPKPVGLLLTLIQLTSQTESIVLDYFAGSGTTAHAVIALNREDGGKRKYILVEMGDHFDTVLKPRIEKVVYSPDWKDGKPVLKDKGISHCFKYLTLESYEDALNNIELENKGDLLPGEMKDEYLLGYMLDVESRGSIINTDDFRHPFDYQLKIAVDSSGASEKRKIDLVETFNYLIGLRIAQYVRELAKGYAFLDGTLPNGEKAFVLWRDCDKVNDDQLNKLLAKYNIKPGATEYDIIYVNGDHAIANVTLGESAAGKVLKVRQIENEFLEKMFAEG